MTINNGSDNKPSDLGTEAKDIEIVGWVQAWRSSGGIIFLDIRNMDGVTQAVVAKDQVTREEFQMARSATLETSLRVRGRLNFNDRGNNEVLVHKLEILGQATLSMTPGVREDFDIFDERHTDHLLSNRHLYIRHPQIMAILRFRASLMDAARSWFRKGRFLEINAPILTQLPLYEDGSALNLDIHGERVFLTQCVGFYLESAVHAFERVYNIGPSFRGEESRSKRHLMEYWHIKAEAVNLDLDGVIASVEDLLGHITRTVQEECPDVPEILGRTMRLDALNAPFPRITYRDAIERLAKDHGLDHPFGKSLGSTEEALLSQYFDKPFWITGIPRLIEPFPYVIDSEDPELTRTADLIATAGFGELLGTAEKITDPAMLNERMREKGKHDKPEYDWIREVHAMGPMPHAAFGMGVERLIRWMLDIPHVRDAIPFPRTFRRRVYP